MALSLIKSFLPSSLIMEDPEKIIKCPKCKLIKRNWQLRTDKMYNVGHSKNNIRKLTIICPNCRSHTSNYVLLVFNDYTYRICDLTTTEGCIAAVICNPKIIEHIPPELMTQEIKLISKFQ